MVVPGEDVTTLVDTGRYPLADPSDPARAEVVARVRADLRADGCSVLADFVRPERREELRRECAAVAPSAHTEITTVNVYNTAPDPALPAGHPARTTMRRENAFVARDLIPATAAVQRLYSSRLFRRFVADCFDLPEVHELADPLSALCLNVLEPGRGHPWHFDTNEFTVSLLTQRPESGGEFEYSANIRSADAENLDGVRAVLEGRAAPPPRLLSLRPGDLQLFRGRYSLHRVRPVVGSTARHSAILAYSTHPGVLGTAERTRQLFGRLAPAHEAPRPAVRVDSLLD
ncbi:HalD/BesD family halogenase [Pseudonocardia humida]|uniref:ArpA protein n=1 Tax=Pseudonocardia humida TaxID=2800819 RepID=A0ABT1AA79_9PSEU|nr:arpA protein [Pseudonocardia humida]MCO1659554.1 arpA protein [Pseudonocardia humida]